MDSLKQIFELMKSAHDLALKHGLFLGDRRLIKCKKCGLTEDVDFTGVLVVYKEEDFNKDSPHPSPKDTGLRFKSIDNDNILFECPLCGTENEPGEF